MPSGTGPHGWERKVSCLLPSPPNCSLNDIFTVFTAERYSPASVFLSLTMQFGMWMVMLTLSTQGPTGEQGFPGCKLQFHVSGSKVSNSPKPLHHPSQEDQQTPVQVPETL